MSAPDLRVGLLLHPQHADFAEIRRAAREAEALGVDVLYTWDHFFPLGGADPNGKHFECWTTLAALAEATRRVQLGSLVTCISYRNPNLLADMARTVDHISGGRLILGIGAGWFQRDYEEYGYEFQGAPARLAALEETIPLLKSRLQALNPPPQGPLPLLIGGGGERRTLRIVATHADAWHAYGDPETMAHKNRVLDRWCAEVGRDPGAILRSASADPARPDLLEAYCEAGIQEIVLGLSGPRYNLALLEPWLAARFSATSPRASAGPARSAPVQSPPARSAAD